MSISTYEQRQDAIYDWVKRRLVADSKTRHLEVIWAKPNTKRPRDPRAEQFPKEYVSLDYVSPATKIMGEAIAHDSGDDFNIQTQLTQTLSVVAYSPNADPIAGELMRSLGRPTELLALRKAAGLSVWNEPGPVNDLSVLLETGFETRAGFDVTFGFIEIDSDPIGTIDEVETEGTLTGKITHVVTQVIK